MILQTTRTPRQDRQKDSGKAGCSYSHHPLIDRGSTSSSAERALNLTVKTLHRGRNFQSWPSRYLGGHARKSPTVRSARRNRIVEWTPEYLSRLNPGFGMMCFRCLGGHCAYYVGRVSVCFVLRRARVSLLCATKIPLLRAAHDHPLISLSLTTSHNARLALSKAAHRTCKRLPPPRTPAACDRMATPDGVDWGTSPC